MSLLIVGTVAFDSIETPFGLREKIIGGSGTHISLSSSFFSKETRLVSVVGGDFPKETLSMLKNRKIDTKGVQIKEKGKTFFWSGRYHQDMNTRDTIDTQLNVLENFDPTLPEEYKESEIIVLGNLMPSIQKKVLDQMKKKPRLIILDTMNFWMDGFLGDLKEVIRQVDVLTINDEEARQLSGKNSLLNAAKEIIKMGPTHLIIKRGEHGSFLFNNEKMFFSPALPVENVLDPTGAGDSFAGGFSGYLDKTKNISFENMKRAIVYGSVLASFCVEKFGTEQLQEITHEEIERRVKKLVELVRIDYLESKN